MHLMNSQIKNSKGFTLIEIAIVLLIATILLGYTVAMFPVQQELKQYRAVNDEMDRIIDAIYAYAQVNGRLPCADAAGDGIADPNNGAECTAWYGFLPAKTLGISGRYDANNSLLDPWGNRYRYQVTDYDTNSNGGDFVITGDMKLVTMATLDPDLEICTGIPTASPTDCGSATVTVAEGIPAVVLSLGKDGSTPAVSNIQLENTNNSATDTVFIRSTISDVEGAEFDDIVKWIAPNTLYSKMIDAGQLP
ncbi:MAG: prepilin-type N-terminal cleavage/methylation domain-containing protein [Gammaproteobacteria bacterium]|jgi:prepilin-type N-terminal cleavage/methylation domain-containing protein